MKQSVDTDKGILVIEYDGGLSNAVGQALGDLREQRFKVLKNAVNATVKQAQADLVAKAQAEYTAKKDPLKKAMTTQKATVSKPEATITVMGSTKELQEYRATTPKSGAKAQIRQGTTLKLIQSEKGTRAKAFLATFESGHSAIVQRQDGEVYRRDAAKRRSKYGPHADITRLKKLLSISFPKMVGGSRVLEEIGPDIYDNLLDNINKEIQKVLRT